MSILICPNCKALLLPSEKTFRCENGHSFDLAKQGYLNLLLPNQKKTINPGDNKQMLNAREAFLSTGHYDFLLKHIESSLEEMDLFSPQKTNEVQLLDLGCGTGYYTRNLFAKQQPKKIGLDISKIGIAKAAVKDKGSTYLVGSVFNLPVAENSIDLLVNIFAPIDLTELKRVLKPGGYFLKIIPIGNHMKEVAELVYDKFIPHESSFQKDIAAYPLLESIQEVDLKTTISLAGQELVHFISMTPYLYKFTEEKLEELTELVVTISFRVIVGKCEGE